MHPSKLKSLHRLPFRRFSTAGDPSFLERNRRIVSFFAKLRSPDPESTFKAAITPSQAQFIEQFHRTFFLESNSLELEQFTAAFTKEFAPNFSEQDLFVPLQTKEEELSSLPPVSSMIENQIEFSAIFQKELSALSKLQPKSAEKVEKAEQKEEKKAEVQDPKTKKYKLEITGFDAAKKLSIIKEVKALLGLGLKEAKDLVEKVPSTVGKDMGFEDMEKMKEKLVAAGCTVVAS